MNVAFDQKVKEILVYIFLFASSSSKILNKPFSDLLISTVSMVERCDEEATAANSDSCCALPSDIER